MLFDIAPPGLLPERQIKSILRASLAGPCLDISILNKADCYSVPHFPCIPHSARDATRLCINASLLTAFKFNVVGGFGMVCDVLQQYLGYERREANQH
jgi:hypothetical protein